MPPDPTPVNRRQVLSGAGSAAAGAAILATASEAAQAPNVADRSSSIKITKLTPILCRDRVYVKIETNHGVTGWGEIKGIIPTVGAALAKSMFELLDGQNPTRIEHLWQILYRAERNQRGGAIEIHTISGIDMALWDITGKLWGVPVYRLLGGAVRDRIRVYPSPSALKVSVGVRPPGADPAEIEEMVAVVKNARQRVGPKGVVMFDAHAAVPPAALKQFAAAISPYDVRFIEEPAVPGNMEVFRQIRAAVKVPLATGERDRTIWGILPYLTEGIVDFVQPDAGYTGGISQMKKIATLAEAHYANLVPHCTQSYLGMTASFHVTATVPLFMIHESYDDDLLGQIVKPHWTKKDGSVSLPEGTGLCVDIDEAALQRIANDPGYRYTWRGPKFYDDGSVADY